MHPPVNRSTREPGHQHLSTSAPEHPENRFNARRGQLSSPRERVNHRAFAAQLAAEGVHDRSFAALGDLGLEQLHNDVAPGEHRLDLEPRKAAAGRLRDSV